MIRLPLLFGSNQLETMLNDPNSQQALLYLSHSVSIADGVSHELEKESIQRILDHESIPDQIVGDFTGLLPGKSAREIQEQGIGFLDQCDKPSKLRILAWVYKVIEVDGMVHIQEAKWLLDVIAKSGIDLDEMMAVSKELPPFTGLEDQ